jgi:predicted nucleic acid-binding protein
MRSAVPGEHLCRIQRGAGVVARGNGRQPRPRGTPPGGELVMASDLVLIECARVLIRAVTIGEIDEATAADRRAYLNAAAAHWHLWRLSLDIVDRARRPFPSEPVRTLDAIHLASALAVRSTVPGVELLSLDDRIRRTGEQLGFRLQPR